MSYKYVSTLSHFEGVKMSYLSKNKNQDDQYIKL